MPPDMVDVFTKAEWAEVQKLGPLPDIPAEPSNKYADNAMAAAFGQRLFFEKSYSGALTIGNDGTNGSPGMVGDKGKIGCVSCHDPAAFYVDTRSMPNNLSIGVKYTKRHAPPLVNIAFYKWGAWNGKEDSIWFQGANAPESAVNFGSTRLDFAHMVYNKYKADYNAIFPVPLDAALDPMAADASRFPPSGMPNVMTPGPWETMTPADQDTVNLIMANCGKALEAYERKLLSKNAPIDKYIAMDFTALTPGAKRGLKLFIGKAACNACHGGAFLSDNDFHVTGVTQNVGPNVPMTDNGRNDDIPKLLANTWNTKGKFSDDTMYGEMKLAGLAQGDQWIGVFRTKSLRSVAKIAPYFHNGSKATLADVVTFYNAGGDATGFAGVKDAKMKPLNLSDAEKADLVEFMQTALTGDPPPAALGMDTSR
jgi:cytochrome c peroxidase